MIPVKFSWQYTGIDLEELALALAEDVAASAIEDAAKNLKKTVKSYVPVVTGKLFRSIDYTVGVIPEAHIAYAVIGPRKGSVANKYAHLVEFGHVSVAPKKRTSRRKHNAREITFVPARPFMRPAAEIFAAYMQTTLATGIENNLSIKVTAMQKKKKIIVRA